MRNMRGMTVERQPITPAERRKLLQHLREHSLSTLQAAAASVSVIGRPVSQSTVARWVEEVREAGDLETLPEHLRSKRGRTSSGRSHAGTTIGDLLKLPAVLAALEGRDTLTEIAKQDAARVEREKASSAADGREWDGAPATTQPTLSRYMDRLAENLAEVSEQLGHVPKVLQDRASRLTKGSKTVHTYPVYGKVRAGLTGQTMMVEPTDSDGRSYYTDRDLRGGEAGNPYALQVEGDSMTDGKASTQFPEGAVVLVNPNREPVSGDFVVAIDRTDGSTTFKRLRRMGADTYLEPLNPAYQPLLFNDDLFVAGVVEEAMLPCYSRR